MATLSSLASMEKISKFGLRILDEDQKHEHSETLSVLLPTFLPAVLSHAGKKNMSHKKLIDID